MQTPAWLQANGLAYNVNLATSPNGDGLSLLMDYALGQSPLYHGSTSLPKPSISGNQMSLRFYAGSSGVTYYVQHCTDMKSWSTPGVTVTGPDGSGFDTATIPVSGACGFMRLQVVH